MGWDLDLEEQRRIYKVLEKRASTGILPAEGVGYFYNSLRDPDHVQGFNKIEESCEKGVDSPGCICQIGRAYGKHSNKNEN